MKGSHLLFGPSLAGVKCMMSSLIKSRRLREARDVLDRVPSPSPHLPTMMINAYAQSNQLAYALELFDRMPVRDEICWNSMIKCCLDCGDFPVALRLFQQMPGKNVVSQTTMLSGYMKFGKVEEAEELFGTMLLRDVAAFNAMLHGYFENGKVEDAMRLFKEMRIKNVISWTCAIGGLDGSIDGLTLFKKMMTSSVRPTATTLCCVLTACMNVGNPHFGTQIHGVALKLGYHSHECMVASLITFYSDCKRIEEAASVFKETETTDVVVLTALLTGYNSNSNHNKALVIFRLVLRRAVVPNQSTLASALSSCSELDAITMGKAIHGFAVKLGLESDDFVGNNLVVMYGKCGELEHAAAVFKGISHKNDVSWNSIIAASGQHGHGRWALIFFCQMLRSQVSPDDITVTALLSACSHSGMVDKGRHFFYYLLRHRTSALKLQHYACVVDLLGRFGKLNEAEELLNSMPIEANSAVWLTLLGACMVHSNLEIAERAAERVLELDPNSSAAFSLLANLYASSGRWANMLQLRIRMKQMGIEKQRGSSWYKEQTRST